MKDLQLMYECVILCTITMYSRVWNFFTVKLINATWSLLDCLRRLSAFSREQKFFA